MAVSPPPAPSIHRSDSSLPPRVVEAAARMLALCREELSFRAAPRFAHRGGRVAAVREATNEFARDVMVRRHREPGRWRFPDRAGVSVQSAIRSGSMCDAEDGHAPRSVREAETGGPASAFAAARAGHRRCQGGRDAWTSHSPGARKSDDYLSVADRRPSSVLLIDGISFKKKPRTPPSRKRPDVGLAAKTGAMTAVVHR